MRTINENLYERLSLQQKEAEIQGLTKTAVALDKILIEASVREDDSNYSYSSSEYEEDVEKLLWQILVRSADFFGRDIDVEKANKYIGRFADYFGEVAKHAIGAEDQVVGNYEPVLPGEVK